MVVGVLTNSSSYPWKLSGYNMEIRFFDKDGKIADLDKSSGGEEFTILPASDHSFRFYLSRKSIPEYVNYKIYVCSAKDPKALR